MTYGFQHCCLQHSGVIGLEWSDMASIKTSQRGFYFNAFPCQTHNR